MSGQASVQSRVAQELGVPVKSVNWPSLFPGRLKDGSPSLLTVMGQDNGGLFVCDVDLANGHCRQLPVNTPQATYPTAGHRSRKSGILYIGSAYSGHLHQYDPDAPQKGLEDLGPIDPDLCQFPCRIDEMSDGTLYIGAHPGCSLTKFDPATCSFTRLGRIDQADQYFYPYCGDDGTLAGLVRVCRTHAVLIDPKTGEAHPVGPVFEASAEAVSAWHAFNIAKANDGLLYIKSVKGNFRLRGMEAIPVDDIPPPAAATFPDGSQVSFSENDQATYRLVRITKPDGAFREIKLDWRGGGTNIFVLHAGPDGKIYGSSVLPEHLLRFDPETNKLEDLGQCSKAIGEAYSMGNMDGKLYIASYPEARLSVYDPKQPTRFGEDESANPRDLGRVDQVAYRPRAMRAALMGKVYVGSIPDYGMWGGTLAIYDPRTGRFSSHRNLLQDCSITALEWLAEPVMLLVGTSIHGGSGTTPRAKEAAFVFFNPLTQKVVGIDNFGLAGIDGVLDIKRTPTGDVYAVVIFNQPQLRAELLKLSWFNRKVIERSPFDENSGWPRDLSLQVTPDGELFGATLLQLYRVRSGTAQREPIWTVEEADPSNYIYAPGPIIENQFYFASRHRLRKVDLNGLI